MVASITLMTMDHRQHHLDTIRSGISLVIYPLQVLVNLPVDAGHWVSETLSTRNALLEENSELKQRQLLLEARLQKFQALQLENSRLRELLHSSQKIGERVLIGELLAVDQDPFQRQVWINKGSSDNIFKGQPLLDAYGVMGQVIQANPTTSVGMLLTDPNHAIPVQVNRNGLRAIALGIGQPGVLEIPHIPNNADIKVGDLLVTSGLGQRFPPGYPVATISAITIDPTQPYARVTAAPTAHLERSREVLMVWKPDGEEAKP